MTDTRLSFVPYILFGMFFLELLFVFVKKIHAPAYGIFDAFEKLYPIIAVALLTAFMKPTINKCWWAALFLYASYLLYGVLISLAHNKGIKILIVQLYHELKFFPMMMLFSLVPCPEVWRRLTHNIISPIIILTLLLIAVQLAVPGTYDAIFSNGGHFEKGHIGGMLLPRLVGWFWHPGQIALFFSIVAIFYIGEHRRRGVSFIAFKVCLCIIFVFIAIQRFELFILVVVLLLLWLRRYIEFDFRPYLAIAIVLSMAGGILYVLSDPRIFWVILDNFRSPRIVFLVESLFVLVDSNYLGSGWGTIGSHAAADIAKVYEYNAMKDIWWVKLGLYFYMMI